MYTLRQNDPDVLTDSMAGTAKEYGTGHVDKPASALANFG
jgi:hypothetical protein